jgi:hypothetical protein
MQSRKTSLIESFTQTFVGILVSFIIQLIIYPFLDIKVSVQQNIFITFVFTIASIIRGYLIRRYFNNYGKG